MIGYYINLREYYNNFMENQKSILFYFFQETLKVFIIVKKTKNSMGFFKKLLREGGRIIGIKPKSNHVQVVNQHLSTFNIGGQLQDVVVTPIINGA